MKTLNRKLDLGRSHLRVCGGMDHFLVDYSEYKEITGENTIRKDIGDPYNDFKVIAAPKKGIINRRFVKGKAMSFYKSIVNQADNQKLKVNQEASYINFAYIVAREIIDAGYKESEVDVTCAICIPTAEHYSNNGDVMKSNLAGKYVVSFPVTGDIITFDVKIENIVIAPEGPIAMTPTVIQGEQSELISETTGVIIDCGEGSCDITLVVEGEAQGDTARSFSYGGITVKSAVASALERQGYSASESNVKLAIKKGYIMMGMDKKYVGSIVRECKKRLAQKIKQSVTSVVNENFKQMADISYFFPVGRNFRLTTDDKQSERYTGDLSEMLKEVWDTNIEAITPYTDGASHKCIDRTAPMKDGKYPEEEVDMTEMANVYGLEFALSMAEDDSEDNEDISEEE